MGIERFLVLGAGAIGGSVGTRLWLTGRDVVLIARGSHLRAMEANGVELVEPAGTRRVAVPRAAAVHAGGGDLVLVAVKSQHRRGALGGAARRSDRLSPERRRERTLG